MCPLAIQPRITRIANARSYNFSSNLGRRVFRHGHRRPNHGLGHVPMVFISVPIRVILVLSANITTDNTDDTDRMRSLVDDSLPLKFGVLEVDQQRYFQAGDVQIAEHLCDVSVIETCDDLRVHDDNSIDNQIGNQDAENILAIVGDGKLALLFDCVATLGQFDHQRSSCNFSSSLGRKVFNTVIAAPITASVTSDASYPCPSVLSVVLSLI